MPVPGVELVDDALKANDSKETAGKGDNEDEGENGGLEQRGQPGRLGWARGDSGAGHLHE